MNKSELIKKLKAYKERVKDLYGINEIGIFGSFARDNAKNDSDIDIVVDIKKPDLFILAHIKYDLEKLFDKHVDIVRKRKNMNSFIKKHINKDAIYI